MTSGAVTFVCAEWVVDAGTGKITDRGAAQLKGVANAGAVCLCLSRPTSAEIAAGVR